MFPNSDDTAGRIVLFLSVKQAHSLTSKSKSSSEETKRDAKQCFFLEREGLQVTVTYHHYMPCNCLIAGQEPKKRHINASSGSCLRFPVKYSMAQVASLIHRLIHIQRLVLADRPLARRSATTSVCVRKIELADRYCSLARRLVQCAHGTKNRTFHHQCAISGTYHESRHERNADNKTYQRKH